MDMRPESSTDPELPLNKDAETATQAEERMDRERFARKIGSLREHYGAGPAVAAAMLEIAKANPPPILVKGDLADIEALASAPLADGEPVPERPDYAGIEARIAAHMGVDFAVPTGDGTTWNKVWYEAGEFKLESVDVEREPDAGDWPRADEPMRSPEFHMWRQRQNIEMPKPRQLFVSKGTEVDYEGNIRTFARSAKATAPDMFDTKRCKLSKRQARKLRKETQRQMRTITPEQLKFNELTPAQEGTLAHEHARIGSVIRGNRADAVIVDDPNNP